MEIEPVVRQIGGGTVGAIIGGLITGMVVLIWWLLTKDKPALIAAFRDDLKTKETMFIAQLQSEREYARQQLGEVVVAFREQYRELALKLDAVLERLGER